MSRFPNCFIPYNIESLIVDFYTEEDRLFVYLHSLKYLDKIKYNFLLLSASNADVV